MLPVTRSEAHAPDTLTYRTSRSIQCLYHVRPCRTIPLHNCNYPTLPPWTQQIIFFSRTLPLSRVCPLIYISTLAVTVFIVPVWGASNDPGSSAQPGASGAGGRREGVRSTKEGKDLYRMIETLKLNRRTPDTGPKVTGH